MRHIITVSSLTPGSGLSRYVFSLCRLLATDNKIYVITTHNSNDSSYERNELNMISKDIKLISLGEKSKIVKYLNVINIVKKLNPDIIINNYNGVVQYILPFINNRIKVVHILHNDTDDFYRIGAINGNRVNGWIAPTKAIADHFNDFTHNKYRDRVSVISHGVEEATYHERHNKTLEIVYAGVLYEHKGVKILPEIIHRLINQGINLHFTIIGGGILSDWLKEQFREEIADNTVTMTGIIDHDNVYALMSKADVFLYPTHLDAFGLVIAEAMMNGAVPVVTHLPGITDNLITDGKDGFLVSRDDIDSFVSIISRVHNNINLRQSLSEAAHKKASSNLSISQMRANYDKYLSLL